jgi:hypothetical protein
MALQGRSYSDPSYGSKKELVTESTGALNGTAAAAAAVTAHTFMQPVKVTDWNGRVTVGGTDAGVISLIIGKSSAGTGAFAAIGTMALSTHAVDTVIDASLTTTAFSAGDDLVVQRSLGTSTSALVITPVVQYTETFEAGDN